MLRWIQSGGIDVSWALRIDTLTAVMLVVVNTVSTLVHIYSIGYMHHDPASAALLRLSLALHFRHADAGDRRQPRADVLRLGRRRSGLLSARSASGIKKPSASTLPRSRPSSSTASAISASCSASAGVFVLFGSIQFDVIFGNAQSLPQGRAVSAGDIVLNFLGYASRSRSRR